MVSPGKPSPGRSVPALSNAQVAKLAQAHTLVDPTYDLTGNRDLSGCLVTSSTGRAAAAGKAAVTESAATAEPSVVPLRRPNLPEINEQDPVATRRLLAAASFVVRASCRVRAYGLENVPSEGVYITAATHVTQFDVLMPMMTMFHLGRRPRFMAKEELSHWPFVGWALRHVGMQPVPRRKGMARAIEAESIKILLGGRPLTIWPEGTVSRDPLKWPMSLKKGIAEIALIASKRLGYQVPIIPAVTWGAASIHHFWPWPRKNVVLAFDQPVDYSDLLAAIPDPDRYDSRDSLSASDGRAAADRPDGSDKAARSDTPPRELVDELTERIRARMEARMAEIRGQEPPVEGMWDYRTMSRVPRPSVG